MVGFTFTIATVAFTVFAASQPPSPATTLPESHIASRRPDAKMAISLPASIAEVDLIRYGQILHLAAPQALFLAESHRRYVDASSAVLTKRLPELEAANALASTIIQTDGITLALASATRDFYDLQDDIARELRQCESILFAEMDSVLTLEQRELLPRVLDHRRRQRCCAMAYRIMRSSQVDLAAVAMKVVIDPESRENLDPVLLDYERELTPLTVALDEEMQRQDRALLDLLAWKQRDVNDRPLSPEESRARSLASFDRKVAILSKGLSLQRHIASLNARTLPALLARVTNDQADDIRHRFQCAVYPAIYLADTGEAIHLCKVVATSNELTPAQREGARATLESYRAAYASMCAEMERECDAWQEHFARVRYTMDKYDPYRAKMRELRARRWQLGLSLAMQIESIIPAGSVVAISRSIQDLRTEIQLMIRESEQPNDRYPGM